MDITATLKKIQIESTNTGSGQWCIDIRAIGTEEECKAAFENIKTTASQPAVQDRQANPCRFMDNACRLGPDYSCDACAVYSPAS
jgi:hypothetical protein